MYLLLRYLDLNLRMVCCSEMFIIPNAESEPYRAHVFPLVGRLQPARRPRKATVPLVPEVSEIEGVLTAWKMPGIFASGGGEAIKGIYLMFHGCHHSHLDW